MHGLPSREVIASAVVLYLKYCNYQPLPLFLPESLPTSLVSRDPEILLAILALTLRFSSSGSASPLSGQTRIDKSYAVSAKQLIMHRVVHGPVELSTIQALCVLSLAEFNDGNIPQASTYGSLAIDLALSSGLSSEDQRTKHDPVHEERRRCYWSIVLLKGLYGGHTGAFSFIHDEKTPNFPQSPQLPAGISSQMTDAALDQPESTNNSSGPSDLGIVAYVIQLSELWQKAARYAHRRGKVGGLPAWSAQSEYSQITAELMDSETRLPYKYRFRPARFAEQDPLQIQNHRDFWASWILLQMLYHTILCLLNHPLLLSLRLKNFRVTMVPEVFLQHTADLTATHTEWILHLLDLCKKKDFELYNPFLAHCAAIAATIYLQQSFSEDSTVRTTKQECFKQSVSFIRRLGRYWPYVEQLAAKIELFERVVSNSFHNSASRRTPDSRLYIDLSLFWEIIESSFVDELPKTADSYFGVSLTSHRQPFDSEEVLRRRLLPEPTRITAEVNPVAESAESTTALRLPSSYQGQPTSGVEMLPPLDEQASILAQSYFAQGQDFVAGLDDWWFSGQPA